jgi:glycosyltransferase involved in cell wall biosynthesis
MEALEEAKATRMKIGYLHLGEREHGVCRYGRILAAEAARRQRQGQLEVVETEQLLSGERSGDAKQLAEAASSLGSVDLIHLQHSPGLWGAGWAQLANLRSFLAGCRAPVVATLHDVYPADTWKLWKSKARPPVRWLRGQLRSLQRGLPNSKARRLLLDGCAAVLVCSDQERERLASSPGAEKLIRIDHFVEERPELPDRSQARRELGLEGRRVVTLLGFIHPSKGHDLLVKALPGLPEDVLVVFAGRPSRGNQEFLDKLRRRAATRRVLERIRFTGYLSEEELARYLVATDLAVAPFRYLSASGSLSTWISVGRRTLCSALPQVEEYHRLEPDAIETFEPYRAEVLAAAIRRALESGDETDPAVLRLRERLRVPRIFDAHLEQYRRVLG